MTDEAMQLREKISTILKDLVTNMIVRGKDWPLGRKAMRTNAIDEIIEVVTDSLQAQHTQELREAVEAERERILSKLENRVCIDQGTLKGTHVDWFDVKEIFESLSPENQGDVG